VSKINSSRAASTSEENQRTSPPQPKTAKAIKVQLLTISHRISRTRNRRRRKMLKTRKISLRRGKKKIARSSSRAEIMNMSLINIILRRCKKWNTTA
jgi:hypothetical protein